MGGAQAPLRKEKNLNLQEIKDFTKNYDKLKITNQKNPIKEIIIGLISIKILLFCEFGPVLNMRTHKLRTTDDIAVAIIRLLLTDMDSIMISDLLIKSVLERIRYLPQLQVDLDKGFRDGQLYINVLNGVYSIMERKLVQLRQGIDFDYITKINYVPGAQLHQAPHFERFIKTSVGFENYECLMRSLGYCISSLTKGRKSFLWLGNGLNGKSTLLKILLSIFDPDLVSHQPFHIMGSEKSRWHYRGKRINISCDNSNKPMKDEDGFKSLISCEETIGREVYQRYIHYTPTLKFIFASNWPLCFAHPDDAIIDRLVVIRFTRKIPQDQLDPQLEEKLKSEKDIIFSLAIDTLKDLIDSNYDFKMSKDSEEYLLQQRAQIHSTEIFLHEECVLDENGTVSSEKLYNEYKDYCHSNAITPLGRNTFLDKVKNYNPNITYTKVMSDNKRVNGFKGIRFITYEEQEAQK